MQMRDFAIIQSNRKKTDMLNLENMLDWMKFISNRTIRT